MNVIPRVVGLIFLWAGTYKMQFPAEAVIGLEALEFPRWVAESLVYFVIVMEIYLGLLLLLKIDWQLAMRLAFGLMFIFTTYLFYLSTLANPPFCGCLGLTGVFNSGKHQALFDLARNVLILWALAVSYRHHFPGTRPDNVSIASQMRRS
jgi:hypothetical protein